LIPEKDAKIDRIRYGWRTSNWRFQARYRHKTYRHFKHPLDI